MHLSDFDYDLPEELIAQQPLEQRDASRMLMLDRNAKAWKDSEFRRLPDYIRPNDVIVVNNTRVFPARLVGQRDPTGGRVEILLTREIEPNIWEALVRPAQRLKIGARLRFGELRAEILDWSTSGLRQLKFDGPIAQMLGYTGANTASALHKTTGRNVARGAERSRALSDHLSRANKVRSLHRLPVFISLRKSPMNLEARGARLVEITLHVGYGTFEPVRVANIEDHHVDSEFIEIREEAAHAINEGRAAGGRVIAVGTTTTRALESSVNDEGRVVAAAGKTELTILPGYKFRITDALLTNFHLPRSSLLLLVAAFAGRELTLDAYRHAVMERFRFYSYGDCMFVI